MAKELKDFAVEINLQGWFNRVKGGKGVTYRRGQKFKGAEITDRMIQAIEAEETFTDKKSGKVHPVVELLGGGSVKELRAAFEAYEPEKPEVTPAPKVEELKEETEKKTEKKEAKKTTEKKPVRRARPSDE